MLATFCRWYLDTKQQPRRRERFSRRFRYYLYCRDFGRCQYCGREVEPEHGWHIEHILPHSFGGPDSEDNLVVACIPCNMRKGTEIILPRGFYQRPRGFGIQVLKLVFGV